jgi:hypothetical protein
MALPLPTFTKPQSLYEVTTTGIKTGGFYSSFIISTVALNIRGTSFDYVNSYFLSNPIPQFSSIKWTSYGNVDFNSPVGSNTLWSQDCPNCLRTTQEDNHGLYTTAYSGMFNYGPGGYNGGLCYICRVRIDKSTISGQPKVIWYDGIPYTNGHGLQLTHNATSNCPQLTFVMSGGGVLNLPRALSTNTWYHLILNTAFKSSRIYGSLDGVVFGTATGYGSITPTSTLSLLGSGLTNTAFVGAITDFTRLNRPATDQQTSNLWQYPFK